MKQQLNKLLCVLTCLAFAIPATAYDFEAGGIYYNILSKADKTVEVTYKDMDNNNYSGKVSIPSKTGDYKVQRIGMYAFFKCEKLQSVEIPNSVTGIYDNAFKYCYDLTSINLPESVTFIGMKAFEGCESLTNVSIPGSMEGIGERAFAGCGLTSLNIPQSASVGPGAFSWCTSLTNVTCNSPTPQEIESSAFAEIDLSKCTLNVPNGCKKAYMSAEVWKDFGSIVEMNASESQYVRQDNAIKRHAWTGQIGKNIPVSVWIEVRSDGLVAGEIAYTKTGTGKPIMLLGHYVQNEEDNGLYMSEYRNDGLRTGYISGKINADSSFSGQWFVSKELPDSRTKEIEYAMVLDKKTVFPKGKTSYLQPAKMDDIGGDYSYSYVRESAGLRGSDVSIKRNGNNVRFRIDVFDPNLANASNEDDYKPAKLVSNKFSYTIEACDYTFECEFFPRFVYVNSLNVLEMGCFGLNSGIEGIYIVVP